MAGEVQTAVFVAGLKQTRKAVLRGTARRVLLAKNADPGLTEPLEALCRDHRVPVRWVSSMQELGQACSLSVGTAAAAIFTE